MDINLTNKRAIVCGSTNGIGKAIAIELATLGADITLVARNEEKLIKTLNELPQKDNQKHEFIKADFSNHKELTEEVGQYLKDSKDIHILVNNTGGPNAGPAIGADINSFSAAFTQHVLANQFLVQSVVPLMKKAGYGRIINIISTSVKEPIRGLGVSNTIRAAVASWAKTLSVELGPFGITVNNILPGSTETDRIRSLIENRAKTSGKDKQVIEEEMKSEIPLKRFADSKEIAAAVAFLATPAASYINGINLPVDGGKLNSL